VVGRAPWPFGVRTGAAGVAGIKPRGRRPRPRVTAGPNSPGVVALAGSTPATQRTVGPPAAPGGWGPTRRVPTPARGDGRTEGARGRRPGGLDPSHPGVRPSATLTGVAGVQPEGCRPRSGVRATPRAPGVVALAGSTPATRGSDPIGVNLRQLLAEFFRRFAVRLKCLGNRGATRSIRTSERIWGVAPGLCVAPLWGSKSRGPIGPRGRRIPSTPYSARAAEVGTPRADTDRVAAVPPRGGRAPGARV
jgi:hypothetical protein